MSTTIILRKSDVAGRVPTPEQLEFGELAVNTADGKVFFKQQIDANTAPVVREVSPDAADLLALLKTVDGTGSGLDADLLDGIDSSQFLRSDENDTFDGDLTITGDLTVSGNTTYVNTQEILISDNILTLNSDVTGTPTESAGIEIERGTESNVVLQWNESLGQWEIASGGTTGRILTTGDVGAGNGLDSDTLDGQEGTYYLDYDNFTNTPSATDVLNQIKTVDGAGSGLDADLLDGLNSSYYTDYTNLTNTPSDQDIIDQVINVDGSGSGLDSDLLDGQEGTYYLDYDNFTNTPSATDVLNQIKTVDGAGSNLDSDLLDGQEGSYYLDYDNFTNVPDPSIEVTLEGKVTGNAISANGAVTVQTELANTGITAGTYGSSTQIASFTVDEDGRLTSASGIDIAAVTSTTWYNANNTYVIETADGSVFNTNISTFGANTNFSNIAVSGLVDGRDVSVDGAKLDGIESGATGDQTPTEILDAIKTVDGTGSELDSDLLDGQEGTYYLDYDNFTNTPTPSDLLTDIKTVDGTGSGLDADLLDGQEGTYYLDYDNFANTPTATDVLNQIKTVDGAGSGLDADLLDGLNSLQFLRSDEDDTFDGSLTISGNLTVQGTTTTVDTETILLADNIITLNSNFTGATATENAGIEVERGGESNVILQWNEDQNYWEVASGGTTGRILTTGDEGAGNGLDADTLDGQQGTYYLDYDNFNNTPTATDVLNQIKTVDGAGSNLDADLLDGQQGTHYLDYSNFTNTSALLTDVKSIDGAGSGIDSDLLDGQEGTYYLNYDNFTNTPTASDLLTDLLTVDGSGSNLDADLLDGQQGTYYLNYNNLTNTPTATDVLNQIKTVDGAGSGLDADLLDGANSAYYLDYDNFDNTPTATDVLNQIKTVDGAGSQLDSDLLDGQEGSYYLDYDNFSNTPTATDVLNQIKTVDGAGSNLDADLLDGQQGTYYLNYDNFTNVPSATDLLTQIKTVDGAGSGLDSDLLDGYTSQDFFDFANNVVTSYVSDDQITITAGNGLTGGGNFTLNQTGNTEITIGHADTSSVSNVNNSNGTVIQDLTFDTYGHVQTVGSVNLDDRYYTETEADNRFVNVTGDTVTGNITLDNNADLIFRDNNGSYPTQAGGFQWTLNNDSARIYAQQPSSDQIDFFFKLTDNAGSTDRFVFWIDDYRGSTSDKYPAQFDGSGAYLSVPVDGTGAKDLTNARLKVPYSGNVTIDNNRIFTDNYHPNADKWTTARTISLGGDLGGSVSIDGSQNVTLNATIQPNSVALGTDTTGNYVQTVSQGSGITVTGGTGEGSTPTIAHADTSSVTNVNTSGKTIIDSLTFDTYGHVTARSTRNLDFYTTAEADTRYVNVTGDTVTGNFAVDGTTTLNSSVLVQGELEANNNVTINGYINQTQSSIVNDSATTSTIFETNIFTFNATDFGTAEVVLIAKQGINRHITKMLIAHDGSTASATEYGTVYTDESLAEYEISLAGGNVVIAVTPANGNQIDYKIISTLISF